MRNTILVVDDDEAVREMLSRMIATLGWYVLVANGVEQGLELLTAHLHSIALVISDGHMGGYGKDGSDLYFFAKSDLEEAKIPFVLLSGNTDPAFLSETARVGMAVAQKPIRLGTLGILLANLIGSAPQEG